MPKRISAADANRQFSKLLRGVRGGRGYIVTVHGRPVAKIGPISQHAEVGDRARTVLLERLRAEPATRIKRWTRDELYEDEP